jgi:hypothetical protein
MPPATPARSTPGALEYADRRDRALSEASSGKDPPGEHHSVHGIQQACAGTSLATVVARRGIALAPTWIGSTMAIWGCE